MYLRTQQPKITIERDGTDLLLECTALLLALTPVIYLLINWSTLPATVPTHINVQGLADAWGPKGRILILPAVMLGEFTVLAVLQRFPHLYNYLVDITEENIEIQYRLAVSVMGWMNLILSGGLALLFFGITRIVAGQADRITFWMLPLFMLSLFGNLGSYLWISWKNR